MFSALSASSFNLKLFVADFKAVQRTLLTKSIMHVHFISVCMLWRLMEHVVGIQHWRSSRHWMRWISLGRQKTPGHCWTPLMRWGWLRICPLALWLLNISANHPTPMHVFERWLICLRSPVTVSSLSLSLIYSIVKQETRQRDCAMCCVSLKSCQLLHNSYCTRESYLKRLAVDVTSDH